jgi:hypothetical protein
MKAISKAAFFAWTIKIATSVELIAVLTKIFNLW